MSESALYYKLLEAVVLNSLDNFVLLDKDSKVVLFNKGFKDFSERFVGVTPQPGMTIEAVTPPARHRQNALARQRVLAGESLRWLAEVPHKAEAHYFDVAFNPVYSGEEITHIAISAVNVTRRIRQDEQIHRDAIYMDIIASNTTDQFVLFNTEGKIEFFNRAFALHLTELFGITPVSGMDYFKMVPENRREAIHVLFSRVRAGETIEETAEVKQAGGSRFYLLKVMPIMTAGQVTHIFRTTTEVTERVIQERAIRQYQRSLEVIFERSADFFLLLDNRGTVLLFNQKSADLFQNSLGIKLVEGVAIGNELSDSLKGQVQEILNRALQGESGSIEVPFSAAEDAVWLDVRYTPVHENDKVVQVCLAAVDVTARRRQEMELSEYRRSLEQRVEERTAALNVALGKEHELLDLKNKFVSMVSHEFKTPLATIALTSDFVNRYAELLSPSDVAAKLKMINRQVTHMTAMLEDVLTIGRYEADRVQVNWTELDLKKCLEDLVAEVEGSVTTGVRVEFSFEGSVQFVSDPVLLRSIFVNLLSNAIKFSKAASSVQFDVRLQDGNMEATVRDTGMGIPEADRVKLFQPFFRAGNVAGVAGTGLGLSIVKKALDKLGGTIAVESEVGSGTAFLVQIPAHVAG